MRGKKEKDTILTPRILIELEMLEETQALYDRIAVIWEHMSNNFISKNFSDDVFRNRLSELSGREIKKSGKSPNVYSGAWYKKVLSKYLNNHLDIFSLFGYSLHPNNNDLGFSNFCIVKISKSKRSYSMSDFIRSGICDVHDFLRELEDLIIRKIATCLLK
ncbi:MAG: hypothetical protein LBR68_08065 [Lachnoclostridium sp.]|jgi:hypothetical protein|nr:hypothetical protein [Lachnoclostridium sp.]